MTPFYADDWLTVYGGDCREVLASLPSDSVDCVVTSPPYWGLRDYGTEGQLGLERTPEEYVANMVAVFREVWRVLKPSGTCWLNLGDSYTSGGRKTRDPEQSKIHPALENWTAGRAGNPPGLKDKDLVGIPWRVAFALQAAGWWLRSDIVWSKPNPMPESVTDRPTKSHEYLFLLTKSARYYFDASAVRIAPAREWWNEPRTTPGNPDRNDGGSVMSRPRRTDNQRGHGRRHAGFNDRWDTMPKAEQQAMGANIRSVWTIATRPYPGAHFAVFPPELPERCIKAGSSAKGVCPECGAPWERVVERERIDTRPGNKVKARSLYGGNAATTGRAGDWVARGIDWRKSCPCPAVRYNEDGTRDIVGLVPVPAVVLDPFAGSGTVGMVANRLSRRAILIDLNPEYLRQQMARNAQTPLGLTEGDAA